MAHHVTADVIAFAIALAMFPYRGGARRDILSGAPLECVNGMRAYMPYVDVARGASCMRAVREGTPLKWRAINHSTLEGLLKNAPKARPTLEGDPNGSLTRYMVEISQRGTMQDAPHITGNLARLGFTPYRANGAVSCTTWRRYTNNLKWLNLFDTLELLEYHGLVTVYLSRYDSGAIEYPRHKPAGFLTYKTVGQELKVKFRFVSADDARARLYISAMDVWA